MIDRSTSDDPAESHPITRRRVAAGAAGLLASGSAYALVGVTPVNAEISVNEFSGGPVETERPPDATPTPQLVASGTWAYEGVEDADAAMCALLTDGELIASTEQSTSGPQDSRAYGLEGPLTEAGAFDSDDFVPSDGPVEMSVPVEVRLEVRNPRAEILTKASAADTVSVTVTESGVAVNSAIGGTATVEFDS